MLKLCIYCRKEKHEDMFNLEHVFPQFLGGAYAPPQFKTRAACEKCNSNLGLFVDAGFEKAWQVSGKLRFNAYAFLNAENITSVPLICMGESSFSPPGMSANETCEAWLGPFGEPVFWVRPKDEKLYWYTGGNPRTVKKILSNAYFLFSSRSHIHPKLTWLTFRDAFEGRKVKKIMCTAVEGADPCDIGFQVPDDLDQRRIEYFLSEVAKNPVRQNRLALNINSDFRFLAKLSIGVAHALFGEKALSTEYSKELYKGLWHQEGEPEPLINGSTSILLSQDAYFCNTMGEDGAVTIAILPTPEGIVINLNIGRTLNWIVKCASLENIEATEIERLNGGLVFILYKQLQRHVGMSMLDFVAHKSGHSPNAELFAISEKCKDNAIWFKGLAKSIEGGSEYLSGKHPET
jgi:hypothetical protein